MRYYLITVKLAVTGKVKKYMLSKKLTYALTLEKRLGNINYIKPLQNAYVVVPITGYNKNRNALLSVGKITGIKKIYRRTGDLFSRSQFVPKDEILDLDHDLGDFSNDGGDAIKLLDWLVERNTLYPIKLHTANPVGRANMQRMINKFWNRG